MWYDEYYISYDNIILIFSYNFVNHLTFTIALNEWKIIIHLFVNAFSMCFVFRLISFSFFRCFLFILYFFLMLSFLAEECITPSTVSQKFFNLNVIFDTENDLNLSIVHVFVYALFVLIQNGWNSRQTFTI